MELTSSYPSLRDGLPVFRSGVYSGGVMSAGVKKYNGSCLGLVKEREDLAILPFLCLGHLGIVFKSETCTLSYALVIGPGRKVISFYLLY